MLHYVNVPFRVICGDTRTLDFAALGVKFSRVITSEAFHRALTVEQL